MVMPIESSVVKGAKGVTFTATGKLGEIAKESVTNVSAVIQKVFGEDLTKDHSIFVQFIQTHSGVEGDSASIAIATSIVSALKEIPIRQDIVLTGSLSILGEVLPIGGVSAKIEGAVVAGMKTAIIPYSNLQDLVISDETSSKIKIIPVKTFAEVLIEILDWKKKDAKVKAKIQKLIK
jgi:Lon-like ATP-dependent protease